MKPWLIGEQNPYSDNPGMDLYCEPPQSAGGRLFKMLGFKLRREYLDAFERRNLLHRADGRWSLPLARERAEAVADASGDAPLVLFGARVAKAFGLAFTPFIEYQWVAVGPLDANRVVVRDVLVLPHPSGLSRSWNALGAAEKARDMIMELVERCRARSE